MSGAVTAGPAGAPPSVRRAEVADADAVASLLDAFNREFDTPTPGAGILATRLRRLLAGEDLLAFLAGEPPLGVAVLSLRPNAWSDGPVGLLDELYVAPPVRGQGTGSTLLEAAEAEVRRRGVETLEINVDGEDSDARRFYERHGYRCTEPGQELPMLYYYREFGAGSPDAR